MASRRACVEEQRPRAAREHVLDGAGHLVARGPDDFGAGVRQLRMERRSPATASRASGPESPSASDPYTPSAPNRSALEWKPWTLSVRVTHGRSASRARSAAWSTVCSAMLPVGRPLAAGRRQQARGVDVNRVVARQRRGQLAVAALDERADADEHAQHVGSGRRLEQVPAGRFEDELDLLLQRPRLQRRRRQSACRSCRRACGRATESRTSRGRPTCAAP